MLNSLKYGENEFKNEKIVLIFNEKILNIKIYCKKIFINLFIYGR